MHADNGARASPPRVLATVYLYYVGSLQVPTNYVQYIVTWSLDL